MLCMAIFVAVCQRMFDWLLSSGGVVPKFLLKRGFLAWCLWPLSLLMALVVRFRFRKRSKSHDYAAKIWVVGNITVGGNGKTPVVIALCRYLKAQGVKVAVVSRGYGGRYLGVRLVDQNSTAEEVGDEALLIFKETKTLVAVARRRRQAVQKVLEVAKDVQVIISDDGLQHYDLPRDKEIVMMAHDLALGNGFLLPAGPLREGAWRLNQADALFFSGGKCDLSGVLIEQFIINTKTRGFVNLNYEEVALSCLQQGRCVLLSAIARPERFLKSVNSLGIVPLEWRFLKDHAPLPESVAKFDVSFDFLLMTAKDAVKVKNWPLSLRQKVCILRYEAELPEALFSRWIKELLIHCERS